MSVRVRVDGVMVLTVLALAGAGYLYVRRQDILAAINPADENNLVNQAAIDVIGQENISTGADYIFGAVDLINPWNESDAYAREVYGL